VAVGTLEVAATEGELLSAALGVDDDNSVGTAVGADFGLAVVGVDVGRKVGLAVGAADGTDVVTADGAAEGVVEGCTEGAMKPVGDKHHVEF
jgi:hypothetical protein